MLEKLKKQIHSKGFNISMLINKYKKHQQEAKKSKFKDRMPESIRSIMNNA